MDAHWPTLSTDPAGKSTVRISRFTTVHYTYTADEYHRSPLIPVLTNLDWIDYHQDLAFMRQDYQRWLLTDEIAGDAEQQYLECGWAD
jgi:hypothetical protein